MKKFITAILVLAMSFCFLTSCDNSASIIKKADRALLETPYEIKMSMNLKCSDLGMNETVKASAIVDGENFQTKTNVMGLSSEISVIDKTMYIKASGSGSTVKQKCNLSSVQYNETTEDILPSISEVSYSDFVTRRVTEDGEDKIITMSDISDEGLKAINDMIKDQLEPLNDMLNEIGQDVDAGISNVILTAVIYEEKYRNLSLSFDYSISVAGKTLNITMTTDCDFDYDNISSVEAPLDKNSYTEVEFDEIFE